MPPQQKPDPTTGQVGPDRPMSTGEAMLSVLGQILAELIEIQKRMVSPGEGRSSVEIAKTTTGQTFKVKAYVESDIEPAEDAAIESFWRLGNRLQAGPPPQELEKE